MNGARRSVRSQGTSFEVSLQLTQEPGPSKRVIADVDRARKVAVHDRDAGLAAERLEEPRDACGRPRGVAPPIRPIGDQSFVGNQIEDPSGPARDRSTACRATSPRFVVFVVLMAVSPFTRCVRPR